MGPLNCEGLAQIARDHAQDQNNAGESYLPNGPEEPKAMSESA
jgi:hypothetical protein